MSAYISFQQKTKNMWHPLIILGFKYNIYGNEMVSFIYHVRDLQILLG